MARIILSSLPQCQRYLVIKSDHIMLCHDTQKCFTVRSSTHVCFYFSLASLPLPCRLYLKKTGRWRSKYHWKMHHTPFTRSSKHQLTIKQMYSKYTCTTCAHVGYAWCMLRNLLDVCLMFASSRKRGITGKDNRSAEQENGGLRRIPWFF